MNEPHPLSQPAPWSLFQGGRWELIGLGATLLLAAVLRFGGIGAQSLWHDEALTARSAQVPFAQVIATVRAKENTPPLYFIFVNAWEKLFGASERSLRTPSALVGVVTVALLFLLGRELFGSRVGLTAAALLALAPFHIAYSQEARVYALLLLLLLVCVWAVARLLRGGSPAAQAVYVIAATLAMYAHTFAVFALLGMNLLFAWRWLRGGQTGVPLVRWLALNAAIVVLFGPWIPATREVAQMGLPWLTRPTPFHEAIASYSGGVVAGITVGMLCGIALWIGWRRGDDRVLLLALLVIVPTVGPWLYGPFTVRYGIVAMLGLTLLCAYAADAMGRAASAGLVVLAAIGWAGSSDLGHLRYPDFTHKPDVRAASWFLQTEARAGDGLYTALTPLLGPVFDYYLEEDAPKRIADFVSPEAQPTTRLFVTAPTAETDLPASAYTIVSRHRFDGVILFELRHSKAVEPTHTPGVPSPPEPAPEPAPRL